MKVRLETLIAGVIVAAAILYVGRWQVSAPPGVPGSQIIAYRLDRWSGKVEDCSIQPWSGFSQSAGQPIVCEAPRRIAG